MIIGYTIGAILSAFGIIVLYQIFTGSTTGWQNVSYPTIGIVLLNRWGIRLLRSLYA